MSSGVCSHFIGTMSVTRFSKTWRGVIPAKAGLVAAMCAASFCQKSVHSTPGQMAFTVIRCAANSLATMRVNVMTPCLATLYGGIVSAERGPAIEAMLMIRPAFRSMKYGATALQVRKTDFVLTANVRSQSSSVLLVKGSPGGDAMPALFTRMSMRPSVSRARSIIVFTSPVLVTSVLSANALRPRVLTSSATFSALSGWMSGMAMSAPSRASASTMPRPMPLPPPVTIATLPASRIHVLRFSIINRRRRAPMTPRPLRSRNWFGRLDLDGFAHRSWLKTEGFSDHVFDGRPVIGIANSWSELTNCTAHLRQVADAVKRGMSRSSGHCMVMGTASTMASMAEALGMTLSGNAAIPASDSRRMALAELSGRRAVEMALAGGPKPSEILTPNAFDNAIRADMAIGGSTNAVIHLVAIAGRAGIELPLRRFDDLSRTTPLLVNVRPSGKYLMEDFFYAGGLPVVLKALLPLLHGDAPTVTGTSLADSITGARCWNEDVIRPLAMPIAVEGGTVILTGNLCPGGAVLKQSAASAHLMVHRGRAVVFEDHHDLHQRIDDPDLPVDETSVLVLKHVGPRGAPGMPEWGAAPIPSKLLRRGVKDMVRISDARMSGTSYGTVVLHVSPESAVGGPLALVRNGDEIELDVPKRTLALRIGDDELARRRAAWTPRPPHFARGYGRLFLDHVLQANEGCDFDFLRGGTPVRLEDTAGPSHA